MAADMTWSVAARGRSGKGATWRHASGWQLEHCGHPTANWPYSLRDPDHPRDCVVSFNGMGFKTVAVAKRVIEGIVEGRLTVTDDSCVRGVRRVLVTASGAEVPA
jgi:hypothetical protein